MSSHAVSCANRIGGGSTGKGTDDAGCEAR